MADAVLVQGGAAFWLVDPASGRAEEFRAPPGSSLSPDPDTPLPEPLRSRIQAVERSGGVVRTEDPRIRRRLGRTATAVDPPTLADLRRALRALPDPGRSEARQLLLDAARSRLATALAAPEETLIALAREEERLETAVRREHGAAEQFLVGPSGPLAEYAQEWTEARAGLDRHHARLVGRMERSAAATVPNLTRLVGARVAARLVARAGSREALGRMPAPRLQLLGSRRRPGGDRGPRFGILFRSARMMDVPEGRQGRFARSLAALAVIAARADALTGRDLGDLLVRRRDRRVEQLRRRP